MPMLRRIRTCFVIVITLLASFAPVAHAQNEEDVLIYPMFVVGDEDASKNHVDFFWTPSESLSSAMFKEIIEPLIQRGDPTLSFSFIMVSDAENDDDLLDSRLGAILSCIPAQNMPAFAIDILNNNSTDDRVREIPELFEASKKFGNTKNEAKDCLSPRVISKIHIASGVLKRGLKTEDFPLIVVNGVVRDDVFSVEDLEEYFQ